MPTYEYRCTNCGHEFEKFKKMNEQAEAECPQCGRSAERLISGGAGLLFKGSGFYITDYRSSAYKEAAKQETKGGTKPAATEPGSSSGGGSSSKSSGSKSDSA